MAKKEPLMFFMIISKTPMWVWVLLAALVALGLTQTRTRQVRLVRATVLPLVMMGLSLFGVLSTFGAKPLPLGAWLIALIGSALAAKALGAWRGATWSAHTSRFEVPGSWLPMAIILSIFVVKFYVGVSVAMQPELKADTQFSLVVCLIYGMFSGLFLARGLNFWTLVKSVPSLTLAAR
jgi:hypothetical protein